MSDWQDISTAPKTGEAFLITTAGPQIDICWWDGDEFRDYSHKQKIKHEWPYMVAWKPLDKPADVYAFEPKNCDS
ncbi:hypothetical protein [uncultured Roseibium sp.]|uniref:hypothetical protein n=1 Tax=uncultured Roseibium sp. TaxID=1936171 RepID=UPI00261A4F62|nr:hypothetical protein [uncultured Roseibium sp.]